MQIQTFGPGNYLYTFPEGAILASIACYGAAGGAGGDSIDDSGVSVVSGAIGGQGGGTRINLGTVGSTQVFIFNVGGRGGVGQPGTLIMGGTGGTGGFNNDPTMPTLGGGSGGGGIVDGKSSGGGGGGGGGQSSVIDQASSDTLLIGGGGGGGAAGYDIKTQSQGIGGAASVPFGQPPESVTLPPGFGRGGQASTVIVGGGGAGGSTGIGTALGQPGMRNAGGLGGTGLGAIGDVKSGGGGGGAGYWGGGGGSGGSGNPGGGGSGFGTLDPDFPGTNGDGFIIVRYTIQLPLPIPIPVPIIVPAGTAAPVATLFLQLLSEGKNEQNSSNNSSQLRYRLLVSNIGNLTVTNPVIYFSLRGSSAVTLGDGVKLNNLSSAYAQLLVGPASSSKSSTSQLVGLVAISQLLAGEVAVFDLIFATFNRKSRSSRKEVNFVALVNADQPLSIPFICRVEAFTEV